MNVRDPFNLRRHAQSPAIHLLRLTATQAADSIRERALEAVEVGQQALEKGRQAVEDMAFTVPKNVPSFTNPNRLEEDRLWGSSGVTARSAHGGVLGNVGGLLHTDRRSSLPMYKDKPYHYAPSQRSTPIYRRKRVLGLFTLLVFFGLWWFGYFQEHHQRAIVGWMKTDTKAKSKADWMKRRERVVEAFELSWDAYERYAWGKHFRIQVVRFESLSYGGSRGKWRVVRPGLANGTDYLQATMSFTRLQRPVDIWHPRVSVGSSSILWTRSC